MDSQETDLGKYIVAATFIALGIYVYRGSKQPTGERVTRPELPPNPKEKANPRIRRYSSNVAALAAAVLGDEELGV